MSLDMEKLIEKDNLEMDLLIKMDHLQKRKPGAI